ncbi:hypothetical protein KVV02_003971 [Mortierella alpina]|uniref:Uncharacterized protein n=1 Tax=Mortierella alpina TaxID=64518 RepID=A0A9P8CU49_MORAP|nr:hypothetical protein KVV02_003971 [Mortierella alpina]
MLKAPTSIPSAPLHTPQPSSPEKRSPRFESSQSDLTQSTGDTFIDSQQQLDQTHLRGEVQEIRSAAPTIPASPSSATTKRHTRSSSTLAQFFAAGAFFSPPCSRVGLVSSSPFAKRATLSIGHALQAQVSADRDLEASSQPQQMVSGRQRTLSNLNGELQPQPQEQLLQPSVSSLLRPILNLLKVHTTTTAVGNSDDDPLHTDSPCEDLPSPIYGRYGEGEKTGHDHGGKELHYAFEAGTMVPFEPSNEYLASIALEKDDASVVDPDIRSLSTSNLIVLESGLQRKVGAIASSGEVIDTPLMNLQEQGYVVVRSRGFDDPTAAELSVVTMCGQVETAHGEASPVAMSASLDERYWQPSVSMEHLEDTRPPSSPDTVEDLVIDVLDANMDTQGLNCAAGLMATASNGTSPVGDECEPKRDKDLGKRLWNTGVHELDLDIVLHAKHGNDSIEGEASPLDGSWEASKVVELIPLPESLVLQGSVLDVAALVPLPESPVNGFDGEYAKFTPYYYLPSLPLSPELETVSSFKEKEGRGAEPEMSLFLLPPLPPSPVMNSSSPRQCTFTMGCISLDMLPPLPPSPELPSKPLLISTSPALLLLPPLPPSPTNEVVCTPKTLEIASTKAQLRYWSQTATRLRDQEHVLTARIDVLIQEMAQVFDKCQETELGLLAKETMVQELRQELVKEQAFGFASVQEAALSIQEKCLMESALEASWKELEVLREAWVHHRHQEGLTRASLLPPPEVTVSALVEEDVEHQNNNKKKVLAADEKSSPPSPVVQEQPLQGEMNIPQAALVHYMSAQKRPTTRSTFFHSLVKLLCLALICTMALVSMVTLLYGQQDHLHQVFQTLSGHADRWWFDTKYAYRQFEAVAEEVLSHLQMLVQRKQKTAEDHVQSMTELFWTAAELWADMDMAELWQSLQISRTWS